MTSDRRKATQAKYRATHRDILNQKNREYRARVKAERPGESARKRLEYTAARRDAVNAYERARRNGNSDATQSAREACRRYRLKNLERMRRRERLYAQTHPEINRAKTRKRRAREFSAHGSHAQHDLDYLMQTQHGRCDDCNALFDSSVPPTLDHIIPLSRGGTEYVTNLRWLCRSCNSRKGNRLY